MISCETDTSHREHSRQMVESLVPVVNKRFDPPLCFLANAYYGYNGGPVLVNIPCDSIKSAANKIVIEKQNKCEKE